MQLNIKDPETCRLVRELTELTGETQTEAVRKAVDDRLERARRARSRDAVLDHARRIVRESGPADPVPGEDPSAFLYDERGLPR